MQQTSRKHAETPQPCMQGCSWCVWWCAASKHATSKPLCLVRMMVCCFSEACSRQVSGLVFLKVCFCEACNCEALGQELTHCQLACTVSVILQRERHVTEWIKTLKSVSYQPDPSTTSPMWNWQHPTYRVGDWCMCKHCVLQQ
jgi:hypothetical protein